MYRHDYILFRVTFLDLMRDALLLKYRYRAVFYFYDINEDGKWNAVDMRSFVRHICSEDRHVKAITENIFPNSTELNITEFLTMLASTEFGHTLHKNMLSRSAIMNLMLEDQDEGKDSGPSIVCLGAGSDAKISERSRDDDLLPTYKAEPGRSSERLGCADTLREKAEPAEVPPPAEFTSSYGRVVIDQRPVKAITRDVSSVALTKVMSELLPVAGMNFAFQYDECFEEQGDWRGVNAAARGTELYELVDTILSVMAKITGEIITLEHSKDISDFDWKLNGEVLRRMLTSRGQSVASASEMVRKVRLLSTACRDIVEQECTLVDVPSPCKVYGDIHGQLRDMLLLFLEYGKPTDKGGDIETTSYVFNGKRLVPEGSQTPCDMTKACTILSCNYYCIL